MCGISGFFSPKYLRKAELCVKMNDAIKHRGPDDEGFCLVNDGIMNFYAGKDSMDAIKSKLPQILYDDDCNLALGFRRLSIVDLSEKGHQPMSNESNKITITFNGEIYNFRELRTDLKGFGFHFETDSDTEVLLKGYNHWGTDVFAMLNGMFALCIVDLEKNIILFARDRFGLKPLFYSIQKNTLCWASEIKAILECDWVEREINWEGVYTNFLFQTTLSPQTCFKDIFSVEPGALILVEMNEDIVLKKEQFAQLSNHEKKAGSACQIGKLISKSVEKQLNTIVPKAVLMSGGIDSTFIAYEAKKRDDQIPCYTVDYEFSKEEIKNAAYFALSQNINHSTFQVSDESILAGLVEKIQHFEEPYVSIEILLNASEIAHKRGYKVVLSGNGADELFGGYMHTLKLKRWKRFKFVNGIISALPNGLISSPKIKNYFQQHTIFDFFRNGQGGMRPEEVKKLFNKEVWRDFDSSLSSYHLTKGTSYADYFLLDMRYSLASRHAYRDDLAAMRYSIEFRYPFLDNELVDYVSGLPMDKRFDGKQNKPLLRKVVQGKLPIQILNMKKRGFSFPLARLIDDNPDVKEMILDNLEKLKNRHIFNSELIDKWSNSEINEANSSKLWQLFTFELWLQKYLDPTNQK